MASTASSTVFSASTQSEAIKEAWRTGQQKIDAAAALRANPEIAADRGLALDLAYEEFCAREEVGEHLDSAVFCAQFSFGDSLRRLLTLHRFLDEHPGFLGGSSTSETEKPWPAVGDLVADFQS